MASPMATGGIGGSYMGMLELMKAQMLMKQDNMLYALVILMVFELLTQGLRTIGGTVVDFVRQYISSVYNKRILKKLKEKLPIEALRKHVVGYERSYGGGGGNSKNTSRTNNVSANWDRADAVIAYVLNIPAARSILVVGDLEFVVNDREFPLTPDIMFWLLDWKKGEGGKVEHINFELQSTTLTVCDIRRWVDDCCEAYKREQKNELGRHQYYFDQLNTGKASSAQRYARGGNIGDLIFSQHRFDTNRTLENVFFENDSVLTHRVRFFLKNRAWYDARGIPYTLGLLLHGPPGTGKTSTIKAIAAEADRHIININLAGIGTRKQLKKLFYDDRLMAQRDTNANPTVYYIPVEKRLYVIEDMDCLDGILDNRAYKTQSNDQAQQIQKLQTQIEAQAKKSNGAYGGNGNALDDDIDQDDDALDLATVLNVLDGTLETPGRMIIITTNYPERLDPALVRPGRIDMIVHYRKASRDVVKRMFEAFHANENDNENKNGNETSIPIPPILDEITDRKWTQAEVAQILFQHMYDPEEAARALIDLDPQVHLGTAYFADTDPRDSPQIATDNIDTDEVQADTKTSTSNIDSDVDESHDGVVAPDVSSQEPARWGTRKGGRVKESDPSRIYDEHGHLIYNAQGELFAKTVFDDRNDDDGFIDNFG